MSVPISEESVQELVLKEGLDMAIPPGANEKQREEQINVILQQSPEATVVKVDKIWETLAARRTRGYPERCHNSTIRSEQAGRQHNEFRK